MNVLVKGGTQRSSSTGTTVRTTHARMASSAARRSVPQTPRRMPAKLLTLPVRPARRDDHHIFERRVLISLPPSRLHARDLVDDVHPPRDTREDGVAEIACAVIEEAVVRQVDEEL